MSNFLSIRNDYHLNAGGKHLSINTKIGFIHNIALIRDKIRMAGVCNGHDFIVQIQVKVCITN